MSALTAHLAGRALAGSGHACPSGVDVTNLFDLSPGSTGRIIGYAHDLLPSTCRRLFDLGFAPGATVDVVRRAPARDPIVYRVADCEIALRRVLAHAVLVTPA